MKPFPDQNFPVTVLARTWQVDTNFALFYEGIFEVLLNFSTTILFIPGFERHPDFWPPVLPSDFDKPRSKLEARMTAVCMAKYSVTPNDLLAGSEEIIPPFDSDLENRVIFYVSNREFDVFQKELASVEDQLTGIHDYRTVSELKDLHFVKFILSRVLTSTHFSARDLRILGR